MKTNKTRLNARQVIDLDGVLAAVIQHVDEDKTLVRYTPGHSDASVAAQLGITVNQVQFHRQTNFGRFFLRKPPPPDQPLLPIADPRMKQRVIDLEDRVRALEIRLADLIKLWS